MEETHGQMDPEVKDEQRRPVTQAKQWESVESNTESLAQESAYQQQLPTCADRENTEVSQQDDGEDENQGYDSLEESSDPYERNSWPVQTEYLDTQMDEKERSQLLTSSDLCHDPNLRANVKQNGLVFESLQIPAGENNQVPKEDVSEAVEIKGGYRYIVVTSPTDVATPHIAAGKSSQPYHLHPEDDQTSTSTSSHCDSSVAQDSSVENSSTSYTTSEESQTGDVQETSSEVSSNKKQHRRDIVDRNKKTLGRIMPKRGSYVRKHAFKEAMTDDMTEVLEALEDATVAQDRKHGSESEHNTPPLPISESKEYHSPSGQQQQQRPPVMVKAKRGSLIPRSTAVSQRKPQKKLPLPTTINVNISLNNTSQLLPLFQPTDQDAIVNLASPHGGPHLSPVSELSTEYQQKASPGKSSHVSREKLNMERSPEQCHSVLQWPLSYVKEVQTEQFTQSLPETPTTAASSQSRGSYMVLPPIGKQLTGGESKLYFHQSLNTAYLIDSHSSESYLLRMEKERMLRASYKEAHVWQKGDINQRDVRSDYTNVDNKAEKMKRQKLYSNVIRNMNKNISRIPFLPAKDQEGSGRKVPRAKALEYAKTIAKPRVKPQLIQKQEHQPEGIAHLLQGLDVSELNKMELLRKRHEEEKKAVACFRKHAV
ncbi:hypothetical protein JOB18_044095 [Solea senegalensis]|uniref:Uncharacterized protein n=1 Tax=Solea senegalensis TaxID=28829 RepID=A0AAV6SHE6_SOLSE|nr:jhy protein homolog [Solea senegalensis]KAG7516924.1 hypothetical protein JOB18_044095 [Solea senegalensis]KAG7516925.1 hypothetical protein JOB18_044095 [Solea senegalensis]